MEDYKYHNAPFHWRWGINMAAHCSPTAFLFTFGLLTVLRQTEEQSDSLTTSAHVV